MKPSPTILKAVEQYVITYKKISGRWHVTWLTPPLKRAIRKQQRLYRKAKQLQTHKKEQKSNKEQAFKTYDYVSNLLDSITKPDLPTLGKRFWSFIKKGQSGQLSLEGKRKKGRPCIMVERRRTSY